MSWTFQRCAVDSFIFPLGEKQKPKPLTGLCPPVKLTWPRVVYVLQQAPNIIISR